jgi:hypothetical protein
MSVSPFHHLKIESNQKDGEKNKERGNNFLQTNENMIATTDSDKRPSIRSKESVDMHLSKISTY